MNALAESLLNNASEGNLDTRAVSKFSAAEVREAIAALVAADNLALADALCEAGLSLHSGDENILAIAALMASLHEDYVRSEEYIRELIHVQHGKATPFTWNLLVRVLRCQAEPFEALCMAKAGLLQHPDSADLHREVNELEGLLGDLASFVAPEDAERQ